MYFGEEEMKNYFRFVICVIVCSGLFGDDIDLEKEFTPRVTAQEKLPSSLVHGCVDVTTGSFVEGDIGVHVPGVQPVSASMLE